MTGVTYNLTRWQIGELALLAEGPVQLARRPDNLLARGFVEHRGVGLYAITDLGRFALGKTTGGAPDDDTAGTPEHNLRVDEVVSITGLLDSAAGDWDEDGFHLIVETEDGDRFTARVTDVETARKLLAAVGQLSGWVAEHDRERAAYDAASPAERAEVLDPDGPCEHDGWTSGCAHCEENAREAGDWLRKAERENPS